MRWVWGRAEPQESIVYSLSQHFCKRLFSWLELLTSLVTWQQLYLLRHAPLLFSELKSHQANCSLTGIMFNLPSPTPTVVCVANRDKPLHDSSGILTISEDDNLVILNGQKEIIWSSGISNSMKNSTAQLLDNLHLQQGEAFPRKSLKPP
ncbi:hypothetical protein FXO38_08908 [Capsicum annuum]|nr:hypothetical protein FXO38_08908 [Capsicum annuum]KAF3674086.1 hypothetical protein FXO37_06564 [Capsicum annuum]